MVGYLAAWMSWRTYFRAVCCYVDVVTALPSFVRGMLDGVIRRIGLTVGKGTPFVYLPSWVPTHMPAADDTNTWQAVFDSRSENDASADGVQRPGR